MRLACSACNITALTSRKTPVICCSVIVYFTDVAYQRVYMPQYEFSALIKLQLPSTQQYYNVCILVLYKNRALS
jgi:hypothetical protein